MRRHYTEAQRAALVELVTEGEATPRSAAARLGIPEATAYYWVQRARLQTSPRQAAQRALVRRPRAPAPMFARLVRATDGAGSVTLRLGQVVIEVRAGFDAALLREVVAALAEVEP